MADTISFARGAPSLDIVDQEGLKEAAQRAFTNDPGGTFAYGTSVGYVPLREWIAEQHGVEPDQVLVTNGSMQADAFLFQLLVGPGDAVIVESPTYDRTLLNLRNRGADVRMVELADRRHRRRRRRGAARAPRLPPQARPHHPQLPEPGRLHAERGEARAAARARGRARLHAVRGRPVHPHPLRGRVAADDALPGRGGQGRLRLLVLEDRLPRHPRRLPRRPAGRDQADPGDRDEHLHLAEHGRPVDRQRVLPLGAHRRVDRTRSSDALRERRDALVAALERELPEARFAPPEGGYFMWVELPEGFNVAELETAAKERGVVFVKGTDFLLEGGENTLRLAYSGVTPEQIDEGVTRLADAARSLGVAA